MRDEEIAGVVGEGGFALDKEPGAGAAEELYDQGAD